MAEEEKNTQPVEELGQDGDDGLDPIEIDDQTSEEQLAIEAQADEKPTDEKESESTDGDEPAQPEDRAPEPETPSEPEPELPQQRTYTEEEVEQLKRQIQSARDREVEQYRQQVEKFNMDAAVEAHLRQIEQGLVQSNQMDEQEAHERVFTEANRQQARKELEQAKKLQEYEQREQRRQFDDDQRKAYELFGGYAKQVQEKLSLDRDDMEILISQVPEQWQSLDHLERFSQTFAQQAIRLSRRKKASRVPNGTPQTRLETGHSSGNGRESVTQRIARLNETDVTEWSEADEKFMRTGR